MGMGGIGGQMITEGPCWECPPCRLRATAIYLRNEWATVKKPLPTRVVKSVFEIAQAQADQENRANMQIAMFDVDTTGIVMRTRDTELLGKVSPRTTGWSQPQPFTIEPATPNSYLLALYGAIALLQEPVAGASSIVVTVNVGNQDTAIRTVEYELSRG
jgi:hypothetical protein